MLRENRQKAYFSSLWKDMTNHLSTFYDTQDPESLHQMRVCLKKIFALLKHLTDVKKHKKTAEHFSKVKALFKHAGNIRSVHVNLQIMTDFNIVNDLISNEQQNILANETGRLYAKHDQYFKILHHAYASFIGRLKDIKSKKLIAHFEKEISDIQKYFDQSVTFDDELHAIRKQVKELIYIHQVLPIDIILKLRLNIDFLQDLQHTLGIWHDNVLIQDFLTKESTDASVRNKIEDKILQLEADIQIKATNFRIMCRFPQLKAEKLS